jgi:hypothetical protein
VPEATTFTGPERAAAPILYVRLSTSDNAASCPYSAVGEGQVSACCGVTEAAGAELVSM